ncbi:hypothetical protein [Paracoccus zhejiangensis]|uniref:Uncharacterized protein n=1 Tax=Paracoccus zhejiangensis TaxID=1077935 RepID=A0A2H5EV33_9RHOB|nr:hypothetical protein [Paracoccus zhejiangensis]AUH63151.1 hypothetical protein CX676_02425 [Paracoccus zhejiangensis]
MTPRLAFITSLLMSLIMAVGLVPLLGLFGVERLQPGAGQTFWFLVTVIALGTFCAMLGEIGPTPRCRWCDRIVRVLRYVWIVWVALLFASFIYIMPTRPASDLPPSQLALAIASVADWLASFHAALTQHLADLPAELLLLIPALFAAAALHRHRASRGAPA